MIITFAHYKWGTGKTTICLNVAGFLAKKGKKLLVDNEAAVLESELLGTKVAESSAPRVA